MAETRENIVVSLRGEIEASFRQLRRELQGIQRMRNVVNMARDAMFSISLPLALFERAIFQAGTSFERSMNVIRGATRATEAEMDKIRARIMRMSQDYGRGPIELAEGVQRMAQAYGESFKNINEMMTFFPRALDLSIAAEIDLEQATTGLLNIMNVYHADVERVAEINDLLATSFLRTTADLPDFLVAMRHVGPVAYQVGVTLNDTISALALLRQAGMSAGQTGTSLRAMLYSLLSPTERNVQVLRQMGFQLHRNAQGQINFVDLLRQIRTAYQEGRVTQAQLMRLGGPRGGGGALFALANLDEDAFAQFTEGTRKKGAMREYIQTIQQGLPFAVDRVTAAWERFKVSMSSGIIATVLARILDLITWILDGLSGMPEWLKVVVHFIMGLLIVIPPLIVLIYSVRFAILAVKGAITLLGIAAKATFLSPPFLIITLIIVLVAALAYGIYRLVRALHEVKQISQGFGILLQVLSPILITFQAIAYAVYWVKGNIEGLIETFGSLGEVISLAGRALRAFFSGNFSEAYDFADQMVHVMNMVEEGVQNTINENVAGIVTPLEMFNLINQGAAGLNPMNPFYRRGVDNDTDIMNDVINGLPGMGNQQNPPGGSPGGNGPNGGQGSQLLNTPVGPIIFGRSPWHYTMAVAGTY